MNTLENFHDKWRETYNYIKTKPGSVVINLEVRLVLVKMSNEAAGPDKIVIGMLIVLDNFRINKIPAVIKYQIMVKYWKTSVDVSFIVLTKKPYTNGC